MANATRVHMGDIPSPPHNRFTEALWYLLGLPPLTMLLRDGVSNGWKKFSNWRNQDRILLRELVSKIGTLAASNEKLAESFANNRQQMAVDIHALRRQSRINAARIRSLVNAQPVARFECEMDSGKCTDANNALCNLFNSPRENMLGFEWLSKVHPEDIDRVKSRWLLASKDVTGIYRDRYRITNGNGGWMWVEASGQIIFCDDGHPMVFLGTIEVVKVTSTPIHET